jgi:hypothetical protein
MQFNAFCNREKVALYFTVYRQSGYHWKYPRLFIKTLRIMRITAFFSLALVLHVSATGLSQAITFSGKNVSLEKVFNTIKKQTGYVVFYDQSMISNLPAVSLDVRHLPLVSFMQVLLKDAPLSYSFEDKTIVISRKVIVRKEKEGPAAAPDTTRKPQ